jgi:hypothetical protein
MLHTPEELSPLAAYEELMRFAKKRGEAALRLALHASVPQGFQPDLLHLLKRNFVPEAGDDPTAEVDTLFSPICEDLGRGYFRFHPHVRTLLLDNLASNYAGEPKSRIARVANFLLFYVEHFDRSTTKKQDQLWRDYLEMQRWVAFAFLSPEAAARQLATALENADVTHNFAARMQLGGLASALATPLVGYRGLLNYAAGLQALELGNQREAEELFGALTEYDLKVGDTVLRPPSKLMEEWRGRHPEAGAKQSTEATKDVSASDGSAARASSTFDEAIVNLTSKNPATRRLAAEYLARVNAPPEAVPALISALKDSDRTVQLAAIEALVVIGSESAIHGLTEEAEDVRSQLRVDATAALASMRKGIVLILGEFLEKRAAVLEAIRVGVYDRNYVPIFLGNLDESKFASVLEYFKFVIADLTVPRRVRAQLNAILPLPQVPVKPILQRGSNVFNAFRELQRYYTFLEPHQYDDAPDLLRDLTVTLLPSLESWGTKVEVAPERSRRRTPAKYLSFEEDVFISYAHADNVSLGADFKGWTDRLQESLSIRLTMLVGEQPKIWRDLPLQGNAILMEPITIRLSMSAFFICVLSPSYLQSEWCRNELVEFYNQAIKTGGIKINNRSRIFKVMTTPITEHDWDGLGLPSELRMVLQESLGYEFFEYDQAGRVREFRPEFGPEYQRKFLEKLEDLAQDIRDLMQSMSSKDVKEIDSVYLAETTLDLTEVRTNLRRMLQVQGYRVLPEMTLPLDHFDERVRESLAQCRLSIHLIGSDDSKSDPERIQKQHRLAMLRGETDPEFTRLIWIRRDLSTQDERYRDFISYLENDPSVYEGAEVLSGASLEEFKTIIQNALIGRRYEPPPDLKTKTVYLICDRQDLQAVEPIRNYLFEQGFEVLPRFSSETESFSYYRENLRTCDAVLVYFGTANTIQFKLAELRKAEAIRDRPFLAKAIYVGGPATEIKDFFETDEGLVIKNFDTFVPQTLAPFIEHLTQAFPRSRPK